MVEYLRSGESKVGYLNKSVERNMLHKGDKVKFEGSMAEEQGGGDIVQGAVVSMTEGHLEEGNPVEGPRMLTRKRKAENLDD
jgi:hypothetical protein